MLKLVSGIVVILSILALLASLTGCGLVRINTNIPLFSSGTVIEVVNGSEYDIVLSVNGHQQKFEFPDDRKADLLKPSESAVICVRNWSGSGYSTEVMMVAKAFSCGEFIAVSTAKAWAHSYGPGHQQAEAWVITNADFPERYNSSSGGSVGRGLFGW